MTITARGLRQIRVDGRAYVWRVRLTKCPCCHARAVVIADASRRGAVIHLPGPRAYAPGTQGAVTPSLIVARIREARGLGWVPGEGRGVFIRLRVPDVRLVVEAVRQADAGEVVRFSGEDPVEALLRDPDGHTVHIEAAPP